MRGGLYSGCKLLGSRAPSDRCGPPSVMAGDDSFVIADVLRKRQAKGCPPMWRQVDNCRHERQSGSEPVKQ